MTPRKRTRSAAPAVLFVVIWSLFTLGFDSFLLYSLARQVISAGRFQPTTATITRSDVETHHDSDGVTYRARISYRYTVNGVEYSSDRYAFGDMGTSSSKRARDITRANRLGASVTAYYDPRAPGTATLRTGVEPVQLFLAVFLTPFNMIMLGGWWYVLIGRRRERRPCAGFLHTDDGDRAELRFMRLTPLLFAGIAVLVVSFISIFVVGFAVGFDPPPGALGAVFAAMAVAGTGAFLWRARRVNSGRCTLVIHRAHRSLTLPTRSDLDLQGATPHTHVLAVRTPIDANRQTNDRPTRQLHLDMKGRDEPVVLAKWLSDSDAHEAAAWIRRELGLPDADALQ